MANGYLMAPELTTIPKAAAWSPGPSSSGKGICLSITHGFQARNLLQTDVLPHLLETGHEVTIIGPASGRLEFREAFGAAGVQFASAIARPGKLSNFFGFVRRFALANPRRNATYNLFNEEYLHSRKPRYVMFRTLNRWLGRHRRLRDGWMHLEAAMIPGREMDALFDPPPALLVTGTPGTDHLDALLLRAARRAGVPTLCVVLSWDNLTSKGYMAVRPERLVVWNERMREEAVELHDYAPADVEVTGVAHFDVYAHPEALLPRSEVCRRLGLDPARPFIVYGTVAAFLFRHNYDVAELLAEAVAVGGIRQDTQIVVRLHPQSIAGVYADDIDAYRRLRDRYPDIVRLDLPDVVDSALQWSLPQGEMAWLASLLKHADVCITVASTLAIDAALCDTPVIGVAFDGRETYPYTRSIRRAYDFTHFAPLMATGGVARVDTEESMTAQVNRYLADRTLDREGRARIVREQVCRVDGRSGERVAAAIARFAEDRSGC